ncbi:MAG: Gfo/Idh/MocA family oxidoreductase [Acidobacteria bacterium]|nr:Gfo/Idh/MocA family oxidoreductase [Acidobacteriota bacterium]
MKIGILGTGAIAHKHVQAYKNIGWEVVACSNGYQPHGVAFAQQYGIEFVPTMDELCSHPNVEIVDVCTFPDIRLQPIELCAKTGKHVQVQKPISTNVATAKKMIDVARAAGICLNVVSQHRFDDSSMFVRKAIADGRLGKILQADAYIKWHRSSAYYGRPEKGSWSVEGGGALINQGIHQVDILLWLIGAVKEVFAYWQLGAKHKIESEDVVSALMRYSNGAQGVIQAATAFWPGYGERVEIHGTKGTCVITGDRLTTWDVEDDSGEPAPLASNVASGASDPMAISLTPFERQFTDFAEAIRDKREPLVSGTEGLKALQLVEAIYQSCRTGEKVAVDA